MKKIKIVTLGCDKNLVDSEIIAGQLSEKYEVSPDFTDGISAFASSEAHSQQRDHRTFL